MSTGHPIRGFLEAISGTCKTCNMVDLVAEVWVASMGLVRVMFTWVQLMTLLHIYLSNICPLGYKMGIDGCNQMINKFSYLHPL